VTIVEFADFEMPFLQHIAPELDLLWEKHKDKSFSSTSSCR